jgi:hypothetical protein
MGALGAEKLPAPNAYDKDSKNAVLRTAPSFGFGTSKRTLVSIEAMKVPGPGAYPIKSIVGTETQGRTLSKRLPEARTTNMFAPGPGTYNSRF